MKILIVNGSTFHFYRTCFSSVRHRHPVFRPPGHPSVPPSFRSQFTSTLAFKSHFNDLFSETTAPMNFKFHTQHDQTSHIRVFLPTNLGNTWAILINDVTALSPIVMVPSGHLILINL